MIEVSIMRSSRRAMVRIQAARWMFMAVDSEMRLNSLPSVDSEWRSPGGEEKRQRRKIRER